MKPTKTPTLPTNAEANQMANASKPTQAVASANPVASKLRGLVQSAKNKWGLGGKDDGDALAQGQGPVPSSDVERLAADASSVATQATPAATEGLPQASATIEAPAYDQLEGTLQGLISPSDFSALVPDSPVSSMASTGTSGLGALANPMDMGPADMVLGQAPATGAGSAAGGAGSAAGAGGAASGAAAGSAAGATAGATAAGAGAVAAGAGVAVSTGALLAGVVGVAAIGAASSKSNDAPKTVAEVGTATALTLQDGYLNAAEVWVDMNDNGVIDAGDTKFGTSENGIANGFLTSSQKVHALITKGGTDISTGLAFEGSYSATAGSTVVNPLTTLVQTMVQTALGSGYAAGKSNAEIQALIVEAKSTALTAVNSALGLAADADLTQIDTVKTATAAGADAASGITLEQAIEINSKALMVANMMSVGSAAMKGAVTDVSATAPSMATLSNFIVQGIVSSINTAASTGGSVALGNSDSLNTIMNTASNAAKATVAMDDTKLNTATSAVTTAVSSTNSLIDTLTGTAKAAAVSQPAGGAANALTQMVAAQKATIGQNEGLKTQNADTLTKLNSFTDARAVFTDASSTANTTGLKLGNTTAAAPTVATDNVAPTVSSITATPARVGDMAQFVVKMSEGVSVKFASELYKPTIAITTGNTNTDLANAAKAVFDPGLSTGDKLVFTYRVQVGDTQLGVAANTSIVLPTVAVTNPVTPPTVIKDLANNNATLALNLTGFTAPSVDSVAPTISISSTDSFVTAGQTTTLTFKVSEKVSTVAAGAFKIDDIVVKEDGKVVTGRISDFTLVKGTDGAPVVSNLGEYTYTAKLAPGSATAPSEVGVSNGKFTDLAGNPNAPSNVISVGQAGAAPSLSIVADKSFFNAANTANVNGGVPQTTLKFKLSAGSATFDATDITIGALTGTTAATLSAFTAVSATEYTATLSGITASTTVKVASGKFTGTTGTTQNIASNELGFKVDTAVPTVTIAVAKNTTAGGTVTTLKAGETAKVTFTLSEEGVGFGPQSVRVSGGYLSDFKQDSTDKAKWTAVFNPSQPDPKATTVADVKISVEAGRFTDFAGNLNSASSTTTIQVDNILPMVKSVTDDAQNTVNKANVTTAVNYTYTFNKAVTDLTAADFEPANGTVGAPISSSGGTVWTVPVTPTTTAVEGTIGLRLKAGAVLDAAGNTNVQHGQNIQAIDTVAPTVAVAIDKTTFRQGQTAKGLVTFTFSEDPGTSFVVGDITAVGGTIASLQKKQGDTSGKVWTAEFTPTADTTSATTGSIVVNSASYTDLAYNTGAVSNSLALKVNTLLPTLAITAAKDTPLKGGETTALTFTFSSEVTGFDATDLVVTGGTVTGLAKTSAAGAASVFTGTFTAGTTTSANPTTHGVKVNDDAFSDTVGNGIGFTKAFTIDATAPTVAITSSTASVKAGATSTITYTFSETPTGFAAADVTATSGTLSAPVVSGSDNKVYTATFTPTSDVASAAASITIAASSYTDAVGNAGVAGATPTLAVDTLAPTVAITSSATSVKSGATSTITYTFSETPTGFAAGDVAVTSGTLSAPVVSSTNDKVYTATFTPSASVAGTNASITVTSGSYTDAATNAGSAGTTPTLLVDTVSPTVSLSTTKTSFRVSEMATGSGTVTFTFSEDPGTSFVLADDTTVVGGALSNLQGTGTTRTATFTPTAATTLTEGSVAVKASSYTDTVGNTGSASSSLALRLNTSNPTVSITSDKAALGVDNGVKQTATLTFTLSEASTDFTASDVTVTGGAIGSTLTAGANNTYTATLTPTDNATSVNVSVAAGTFKSASNEDNLVGTLSAIPASLPKPVLTLAFASANIDGTLKYTVDSTAAVTGLETSDFAVTNGTVTSLTARTGTTTGYDLVVTPTATGTVSVAINNEAATNIAFKTAAVTANTLKVALGTANVDTLISGTGAEYVFPGAGNDILKITATAQSPLATPDTIMGIALGDVLDVSGLLTGYTSFKTADAQDLNAGFIEIKNQTLTQAAGLTTVKFDVTFDSATYTNGSKINGAVIDLAYANNLLKAGDSYAESATFLKNNRATDVWPYLTPNLDGEGKIALAPDFTTATFNLNPIIDAAASNKTVSLTLVINSLVDSFKVGFDAGKSTLTLVDGTSVAPALGISKTAYKTGVSATSVEANALILIQDATTLGTVTDNQFRFVEAVDANNNKTGSIKFQYDTNSVVGTTTLSEVVMVNLTSAAELSTFFAADHYKVI